MSHASPDTLPAVSPGSAVGASFQYEGETTDATPGNSQRRLKICLAAATPEVYSETFVRDHISRLPGDVKAILGDWPGWRHNNRRVLPLYWTLLSRVASRTSGQLADRVRNIGARHLASFIRQSDVLLAEFGPVGARLVRTCRLARVPLVVHFHGYDAYKTDTLKSFRDEYAEMFREAAAFVVVSLPMREQVIRLGAPPQKVFVNSCGVDTDLFPPVDAGGNPPHFLAVGRFVEKKAPHLTILAFEKALRRCDGIRLTMAGDGPLFDSCKLLVRALRLEDAVTFPGVVNHEKVAELMSGSRAFLQHSVTAPSGDSEGNPVVILEAGASALPVISTRHAGITNTVVHGETGWLSDETDIDSMAEHIVMLAKDPGMAAAMGRSGRERIRTTFSSKQSIAGLYSVLAGAAAGAGVRV